MVLADFGSAKALLPGQARSQPCGTAKYWAPEAVRRRYDRTSDVARSELHRLAGVVLAAPPLLLVSLKRGDDRVHVVIGKMSHFDPDVTPEVRYTELRAIELRATARGVLLRRDLDNLHPPDGGTR